MKEIICSSVCLCKLKISYFILVILLPLCLTKACITRYLVEIGPVLHPFLNRALVDII